MADSVLRVARNEKYKTIHLRSVESDERLSWKAVGLHTYLISRPDGWSFNHADLVARHSDGKSAVTSGLKELRASGYLRIEQERDEKGQLQQPVWYVSEAPIEEEVWRRTIQGMQGNGPHPGFPDTDNPHPENPHPDNPDDNSKKGNKENSRNGGSSLRSSPPSELDREQPQDGEAWNTRLAHTLREQAYLGDGPPDGWELGRCLSRCRQLLDGGYAVADLDAAICGLRWLTENGRAEAPTLYNEALCDSSGQPFIRPGEKFRAVVFERAEERGQKLVKLAAHAWHKHAKDVEAVG